MVRVSMELCTGEVEKKNYIDEEIIRTAGQ